MLAATLGCCRTELISSGLQTDQEASVRAAEFAKLLDQAQQKAATSRGKSQEANRVYQVVGDQWQHLVDERELRRNVGMTRGRISNEALVHGQTRRAQIDELATALTRGTETVSLDDARTAALREHHEAARPASRTPQSRAGKPVPEWTDQSARPYGTVRDLDQAINQMHAEFDAARAYLARCNDSTARLNQTAAELAQKHAAAIAQEHARPTQPSRVDELASLLEHAHHKAAASRGKGQEAQRVYQAVADQWQHLVDERELRRTMPAYIAHAEHAHRTTRVRRDDRVTRGALGNTGPVAEPGTGYNGPHLR